MGMSSGRILNSRLCSGPQDSHIQLETGHYFGSGTIYSVLCHYYYNVIPPKYFLRGLKLMCILLSAMVLKTYGQSQIATWDNPGTRIKIPAGWIAQVASYSYDGTNREQLLHEFESFIRPDSIHTQREYAHDYGIFNPLFVNLDEDQQNELIVILGWSEDEPTMAVFKNIDRTWYLVYMEPFNIFYRSPELTIANTYSKNKTFYIRWLYDRGSGVYRDAYHFYKLIDNRVYHCLELINDAHIGGWGLYLNQSVSLDFDFGGEGVDAISAMYDYSFFPGAVDRNDPAWTSDEEMYFVSGHEQVSYLWDDTSYTYKPVFNDYDSGLLTMDKLSCFGAFGNDSLFVEAFDYEIGKTLETGNEMQKKLLKQYLGLVAEYGHAEAPSGKLEEKTEIGGLKFYGPKEEK
jgi:hypothetical protein